tara:strand:- start:3760 stop:5211 length:1452 start_codon:yes stop_codon:yes gene_type:complete
MNKKKKSLFYRLGRAWSETKASGFTSVDPAYLGQSPESFIGSLLGQKIADFFDSLPDELADEIFEEFGNPEMLGMTGEAYFGYVMGQGLAEGVNNFKQGVADGALEERTPDEIDAQREAAGLIAGDSVEESQVSYSNITQRVAETSRARVKAEEKPSPQELRDAAYKQYTEDGNVNKLMNAFAEIDQIANNEELLTGAYEYELGFTQGSDLGYYGLSNDPFALETYRDSANNQNLTPLYNQGLEVGFLENLPPERVIDFQIALVQAGFLEPNSFAEGRYDEATQTAVTQSFYYMNPKTEFGIDTNDLEDIAVASGGNNAVFLGFIRDFYLDSLDSIKFTDTNPIFTGPDIVYIPKPGLLNQQIENAITSVGLPNTDLSVYAIQDWANNKIKELNQEARDSYRLNANQLRMAQEDALRRKKFNLPDKQYEIQSVMSSEDVSNAFEYELNKYILSTYGELIESNQVDQARKEGTARLVAAFSAGR